MGWKTIKQHYGIKHIVQVSKRKEYSDEPVILIGSPYISDIIVSPLRANWSESST